MAWKINGVTVSETSKVNSNSVWGTGNKMNGVQLNVCYTYELTNNNPPPPPPLPPDPPINFTYTDCFGDSQNVNVNLGPPTYVCALVGTVVDPPGGISNVGSRCTS
jgi:hypothetical protein